MRPSRFLALGVLALAACDMASAQTRAPVPGAIDPAVSQGNVGATICRREYTRTVRPPREWTDALKRRLVAERGSGRVQDFELDHLIPLDLGGAPRDLANLWLQPWPEARRKDEDEARLARAVCAGRMTLKQAQTDMLRKWGPRP